ncbi:MAG: hypothetical protein AAGM21_10040 [Pseudomonadota bacterium]
MRWMGLLVMLWAGSALAEPRQFDAYLYERPDGWVTRTIRANVQSFHSNLRNDLCEFCYLHLGGAVPLTGDLATAHAEAAARFVPEGDLDRVTPLQPPRSLPFPGHEATLAAIRTHRGVFVTIAVDLGADMALMGFEGRARSKDQLTESLGVLQSHALPFFSTVAFVTPDDVLRRLPMARPQGIEGAFWGWRQRLMPTTGGGVTTDVSHRVLILHPDGHFNFAGPPEGGFDRRAMAEARRTDFGVFERSRRQIILTYASGRTETLFADGAAWSDGDYTLAPVELPADGTALAGRLTDLTFSGAAGGGGGAFAQTAIDFTADGRFVLRAASGGFTGFSSAGASGEVRGTYKVAGGRVVMTSAGERQSLPIINTGKGYLIGDTLMDEPR